MNYQTDLIIVNFNTKKLLVKCLESIRRHTGLAEDYRLWVIDNHSTDGSASLLHNLRWVNSIFNRQNLGYATACNQGIKAGKGKYIFLLNSDLLVTPGWLPPLIKALASPEVAVVGPRLISPDGFLVGAGVVGANAHPIIRGWGEPDHPQLYAQVTACLSICGACMGIKRELLPELGYFDENYFHYFEETDYCYNARHHGYKVLYIPESKVIHLVNGSCRNRRRLNQYFLSSKAYFEQKWKDLPPEEKYDAKQTQTMDCSDLC